VRGRILTFLGGGIDRTNEMRRENGDGGVTHGLEVV